MKLWRTYFCMSEDLWIYFDLYRRIGSSDQLDRRHRKTRDGMLTIIAISRSILDARMIKNVPELRGKERSTRLIRTSRALARLIKYAIS